MHGFSEEIKLNNFNISHWNKRKEILDLISTASEAYLKKCLLVGFEIDDFPQNPQ